MRARFPDHAGHVERDGVEIGYEIFGDKEPTILLLPTWTIIHSRFWKMQVPYLARHFRVITYDGPGNGRSDRVTDPDRYSADSYMADAMAVLDHCGVDRVVAVGLSLGSQYAIRLAFHDPDRVAGLVLIGSALPLAPPLPDRASIPETLTAPYPDNATGWEKYNIAYWYDHYEDFSDFFFRQCFSEPHSTKPIEDSIDWARETGPEVLEADARRPLLGLHPEQVFDGVKCPVLIIHGTDDRIISHQVGVEAARLSGGSLVSLEGSGHIPNVRDPVRVNLLLREFVEGVAS